MRGGNPLPPEPHGQPRRTATPLILAALCFGFLILAGLASLPLVSGASRTLAFTSQDIPPYARYAAFSMPFWMRAGEVIQAELSEIAHNATSGAEVWRGPVAAVFLHLPLNQSGPRILGGTVAPADGYYVLEVHNNDCQSEVALCLLPYDGIVFQTSGTATIYAPRPFPFLPPSTAWIAEPTALAGFGVSGWFLVQWRRHRSAGLRDIVRLAVAHPLVPALLAAGLVVAGAGLAPVYYRSQVTVQVVSMGSVGFASDHPCVPGEANPMFVYVGVFNGVDEAVYVQVGLVTNGTIYGAASVGLPPHGRTVVGVFYSSYDCQDPAAYAVIQSVTPQGL